MRWSLFLCMYVDYIIVLLCVAEYVIVNVCVCVSVCVRVMIYVLRGRFEVVSWIYA